ISSGNGILAWPLGGLLLIWPERNDSWTRKKWVALVWLIACAAVVPIYRLGYHMPDLHGYPYVRTPAAIAHYALVFMGGAFAYSGGFPPEIDSLVLGGLMILGILASAIYFLVLLGAGRRE